MNVIARTSLFTGLAVLSLIVAVADADPWKIDANTNVSTALDSYSDNWVGGEAGTFTWATQFLGAAERQLSPKFNTKTTLNLQFGQTVVQDKTTKDWSVPQKSTDLIDGLELLRLTLGGWADPFLSVRAISEFLDGSDKLLVRYINPFDITEAVGASRTLAKNGDVTWSSRLGGAVHQIVDRHHLDTARAFAAPTLPMTAACSSTWTSRPQTGKNGLPCSVRCRCTRHSQAPMPPN